MLIQNTGVTFHDKSRSTPGHVLLKPSEGHDVYLIDYDGKTIHSWKAGGGITNWCYLLPNGNLFVNERCENPRGVPLTVSGLMREYDLQGNIVWEHLDPYQHHDARRLNGGVVYLAYTEMKLEDQRRVAGGIPGTEPPGGMAGEVIREVDERGNIVWEWDFAEVGFDRFPLHSNANRWSNGHTNTIQILRDGNYLISSKVRNLVLIVERRTRAVVWHYQNDELGGQHDAQMLDNGNVLLFANGAYAADLHHSQVWEINLATNEIVWRYIAKNNPMSFFSPHIGGCQRLPSGNTLICEGAKGCIFEVTPDGDVVWEYVCPYFNFHPRFGNINWLFRARHYLPDAPELQRWV
jgi:outer membrane protein assembly factor BamB